MATQSEREEANRLRMALNTANSKLGNARNKLAASKRPGGGRGKADPITAQAEVDEALRERDAAQSEYNAYKQAHGL